jgi:hypothetical protein
MEPIGIKYSEVNKFYFWLNCYNLLSLVPFFDFNKKLLYNIYRKLRKDLISNGKVGYGGLLYYQRL